jgi:regulator of protease activity HflC (stomatin/prohibitin superfamily)
MEPVFVVFIIIALFVIIFTIRGIKIIQQSQTMVVERLGKYHRTLESGINIIIPVIDIPRKIEWKYVRIDPAGRR